jgi:putative hydrolase of the HAD superfamily
VAGGGLLKGIRAVAFDAVGTLITPDPPLAAAYYAVGLRHGSRLDENTIRSRFRAAFRAQEDRDRTAGWRTGPDREVDRWRRIVASVLDDVGDGAACFAELWDHFSSPTAWRCLPDVGPVLAELSRRGLTIGMASNFDSRLRNVAAGLADLGPVRPIVVSAEVGWRKPAHEFFAAAVVAFHCSPQQLLVVGDDFENDYAGGTAAGLRAIFLGAPQDGAISVAGLSDLLDC